MAHRQEEDQNESEHRFVEPEIPPNTGNIARTCAATDTKLHLVRPLGFDIDDKHVRRAGLDYWPYVDLEIHDSLDSFMKNTEAGVCGLRPQKAAAYMQMSGSWMVISSCSEGKREDCRRNSLKRTVMLPYAYL